MTRPPRLGCDTKSIFLLSWNNPQGLVSLFSGILIFVDYFMQNQKKKKKKERVVVVFNL